MAHESPAGPEGGHQDTVGSAWLQWQLREAERVLAQALTCCVTLGK